MVSSLDDRNPWRVFYHSAPAANSLVSYSHCDLAGAVVLTALNIQHPLLGVRSL